MWGGGVIQPQPQHWHNTRSPFKPSNLAPTIHTSLSPPHAPMHASTLQLIQQHQQDFLRMVMEPPGEEEDAAMEAMLGEMGGGGLPPGMVQIELSEADAAAIERLQVRECEGVKHCYTLPTSHHPSINPPVCALFQIGGLRFDCNA